MEDRKMNGNGSFMQNRKHNNVTLANPSCKGSAHSVVKEYINGR